MTILEQNLQTILNEKTTKIIPENIKKGVQIFDITGTLEPNASIVEGAKLFKTKDEMQADTTAKEGDLAIIYRNQNTFDGIYIYKNNNWELAPTQLTATPDHVYQQSFYSKNGVESGALAQNISNSFNDTNADIYSKIQLSYNNISPRVLTDSDKSIDNKIFIIPVKLDGTPLLDTSKVTDMFSMFYGCINLTTIPELNTSSATNMSYMFNGCSKLTTIPLLDTSKVTDMQQMFYDCTSLSDDSLNNIMQMCINATSYTNKKTLRYIGLTSEQADRCKTLSNYSAFTSAGWTTGY